MDGELFVEIKNQIAEIEFHHPKGNSLPGQLLNELASKISDAGENKEVKVILLKSRGKTFCAGASFDELLSLEDIEKAKIFFSGFGTLIESIKNCPKFVIAEVQGKAVGGGVGIIAACDYAIASETASIKLSELSIGFGPFVIAPAVIRKIGLSAFSTLTIDSTSWKSADWANEKGLYNDVVSSMDELLSKSSALCTSLSGYSTDAMKEIKNMLWDGYENLAEVHKKRALLSGTLSQSELTQQILSQFKK